jgi:hypothetical protein
MQTEQDYSSMASVDAVTLKHMRTDEGFVRVLR